MAVTNLAQYYSSKGQALPSLQSRAPIYEQYGLGAANTYQGTAAQNTALLSKLMGGAPSGGGVSGAPAAPAAPAPSSTPSPTDYLKTAGTDLDQKTGQLGTDLTGFLGKQQTDLSNYQDTTNAKYNVPELSTAATALQNRIYALKNNAGNILTGYGSGAQNDNLINSYLNPNFEMANNSAQTAQKLSQGDITNFINQQLTATNAYTAEQKNKLDSYIAQYQTGAQLTSDQWKEMQTLADNEKNRLEDIQKTNLAGQYSVKAAGAGAAGQLAQAAAAAWKQQVDGSWINVNTGQVRTAPPITTSGGTGGVSGNPYG